MQKVILIFSSLFAALSASAIEYHLNVISETSPQVYLMPSVAGNTVNGAYWQTINAVVTPQISAIYQPELVLPSPSIFQISKPDKDSVFEDIFLHFFDTNFQIYDK